MFHLKKIKYLVFLFFCISSTITGQSLKKKFLKLSAPEKCWVIFHPFKAKRAYRITKEVERITDSIQRTNILDQDKNGGQVDAFRHAFWMATLAQKIGRRSAKSLGKAHEKGNYKQFKKGELEEGTLPDAPASEMDLLNNAIGIEIYKSHKKASKQEFIRLILEKINLGKLKILKKDEKGNYLDCKGKLLRKTDYQGLWNNSKCVIPSKEQF